MAIGATLFLFAAVGKAVQLGLSLPDIAEQEELKQQALDRQVEEEKHLAKVQTRLRVEDLRARTGEVRNAAAAAGIVGGSANVVAQSIALGADLDQSEAGRASRERLETLRLNKEQTELAARRERINVGLGLSTSIAGDLINAGDDIASTVAKNKPKGSPSSKTSQPGTK